MITNKGERKIIKEIISKHFFYGLSTSSVWISANRKTRPTTEKALRSASRKGLIEYHKRGKTKQGHVIFAAKFSGRLSVHIREYKAKIGRLIWSESENESLVDQLIKAILTDFKNTQKNEKN